MRNSSVKINNIEKPTESTIVRARDTIYPTIQEPIKSASAIDSSRLLGWEKDTKLLEKPATQVYQKETVKVNIPKQETPNVVINKQETLDEKPTPTIYPTSIDYTKLPKSATGTHLVIKGDTMYNIAKRYNITLAQIMEWNNLAEQSIKLGQVLKIQQ